MKCCIVTLWLAVSLLHPALAGASDVSRWEFDVYVNDKKVGTHRFVVEDRGAEQTVRSEARFDYRILFIPAYRYEHRNAERWADNCLLEFEAATNANGERIEVSGSRVDEGFRVEGGSEPARLPGCVMSFAYWNPDFLDESRLLNPQTGAYVDVDVEELGDDVLTVRGEPVPATRYRLTASGIDLTLWYSENEEWLALRSVASGGQVIRYELS